MYIKERRDDCQFFIFSDDLEWCRQYFIGEEFHFVDGNTELKTWRDMYLMTLCQDHINANSSFSWWGAWLSNIKEGITIRPKWFIRNVETKDFYPKNWIEI